MARPILVTMAAMLLVGTSVGGQRTAALTCPPGGYAPPLYGSFGQNGGGGQTAYEIASPCIPQAVRDAAEAIGMDAPDARRQERHHDHVFRRGHARRRGRWHG